MFFFFDIKIWLDFVKTIFHTVFLDIGNIKNWIDFTYDNICEKLISTLILGEIYIVQFCQVGHWGISFKNLKSIIIESIEWKKIRLKRQFQYKNWSIFLHEIPSLKTQLLK